MQPSKRDGIRLQNGINRFNLNKLIKLLSVDSDDFSDSGETVRNRKGANPVAEKRTREAR
jgi:hypothetical protein